MNNGPKYQQHFLPSLVSSLSSAIFKSFLKMEIGVPKKHEEPPKPMKDLKGHAEAQAIIVRSFNHLLKSYPTEFQSSPRLLLEKELDFRKHEWSFYGLTKENWFKVLAGDSTFIESEQNETKRHNYYALAVGSEGHCQYILKLNSHSAKLAFMIAAKYNRYEIARHLLQSCKESIDLETREKAFIAAGENGHALMMRLILESVGYKLTPEGLVEPFLRKGGDSYATFQAMNEVIHAFNLNDSKTYHEAIRRLKVITNPRSMPGIVHSFSTRQEPEDISINHLISTMNRLSLQALNDDLRDNYASGPSPVVRQGPKPRMLRRTQSTLSLVPTSTLSSSGGGIKLKQTK